MLSEGDGYFSENILCVYILFNIFDFFIKLSIEVDIDIFKKLMFCRLKIISENSMDSVIFDVISELEGKDGKEDFD